MVQLVKPSQNFSPDKAAVCGRASDRYRSLMVRLLAQLNDASLILIEGDNRSVLGDRGAELSAQIHVHDDSMFKDIIQRGSIGAAEAYIDGKWTSPDLTAVIQVMARNQSRLDAIENKVAWLAKLKNLFSHRQKSNTLQGSKRNILAHYDLGNELYERFLDSSMLYSCALYSDHASNLKQAQQNKLHNICEKLDLSPEDHVLEIGTGWGALALYMAEHYGCQVTTTTISDAQYAYTRQRIEQAGLGHRITLLKQDYRKLDGQFDKLVSIEMIEAVGHEHLGTFFETCSALLNPNGKMLLQAITIADSRYDQYRKSVDFIQKYIFPGGCLPSTAVMSEHLAQRTDMVISDIEDIGLHYARTLHDWRLAFVANWPALAELGYSKEFRRLWLFYFCYCEGAFKERVISTQQIVTRKPRHFSQNDETILAY